MSTRHVGWLSAAMLALSLSACSAIKIGYNNLDELLFWWLNDYVDFAGDQPARARAALGALHRWHRGNELVPLADALEHLSRDGGQTVSAAHLCTLVDRVNAGLERTVQQAAPAIAAFAPLLDDAQLASTAAKFRDKRKAWHADWAIDADDQARKRRARFVEMAERFYGTLGVAQEEIVRRHVAQVPLDTALVEREMQRRERDALVTLRAAAAAAPTEREALVRAWLGRLLESPDAAYRRYQHEVLQSSCEAWSAIHAAATPEQRHRAIARAGDYAADLRALAAQKP